MHAAYLALGSNLGDRASLLHRAIQALGAAGLDIEEVSPIYETDAVASEPQPPYLNAVVRARTALEPEALLEICLLCEKLLGRVRAPGKKRAPRLIDIDVLLVGTRVLCAVDVEIPHPELLRRPFVRIPLADVAEPGLVHPITREGLDGAAAHPGVRRFPAG